MVINVTESPSDADRRSAKFLELRAIFIPLAIDSKLSDAPKSFVAAIQFPLDDRTEEVTDVLETSEQWTSVTLVMTSILQTTAALLESLELREVQHGRYLIKEQTITSKMTAFYDKNYFNTFQKNC